MSEQPATDESLPNPTPDETSRLMREGSHSRVPWWKRLLPPWAFSIGLHLFLLPFVLVVTVTFADSLFVATVGEEVRSEQLANGLHSNLIVDRDYPVAEVHEKVVPLVKGTDEGPPGIRLAPTGPVTGIKSPDPSVGPVSTEPLKLVADENGQSVRHSATDPVTTGTSQLSREEQLILNLVNDVRAKHRKKPPALKVSAILCQVARKHAATMAKEERLDEDLDVKKLEGMLTSAGYRFKAGTVAANQTADLNLMPTAAFMAWAENIPAREQLLEANEETGIGIARSARGEIFYLMIYATLKK